MYLNIVVANHSIVSGHFSYTQAEYSNFCAIRRFLHKARYLPKNGKFGAYDLAAYLRKNIEFFESNEFQKIIDILLQCKQ